MKTKNLIPENTISQRSAAKSLAFSALLAMTPMAMQAQADTELLGSSLTPVGAEKAGNTDGTIPEWTGGLSPDQGVLQSDGSMDNPFKNDAVQFTITAKNLDKYRNRLSDGQIAMFERHPDTYKMNVYPTRRSASYPEAYYQATKTNPEKVQLTDNGNGLNQLVNGVPFPTPTTGIEVIWNHMLRYRGDSITLPLSQVVAEASGRYKEVTKETVWHFAPSITDAGDNKNLLFFYKSKVLSPVRLAGEVTLVHEPINQVEEPRRAWKYLPGQRRVRRAPNVAYDNPASGTDNLKTADNSDMFNGAPDRYEWTLIGKKELYIPYNSYALYDKNLTNDDIIRPGHINPDLVRYELHRVWEVEATLKEGERHVYSKRTFYVDEDTWQASIVDHYDSRNQLWRMGEAHAIQYNPKQVPWLVNEVFYDLNSGRYVTNGLANAIKEPLEFGVMASKSEYTPAAIRRWGK
ncbi:DUF1329 domain-containing protein [Endozoicomonas ascidiicola]|uniref:DUF1329 domain-containing protein n=1 Tax=Endozoicomonas ascidiicola TaxID=1698521 RepID=UPI000AA1E1CB|nr:DUF1329 domain-containing protein [Endozoicomonas ascidiicola]